MKKPVQITHEQDLLCRAIAKKFVSRITDRSSQYIFEVEESLYQASVVAISHNQLTGDELKVILKMRLEAIMLFASGLIDFVKSIGKQEKEQSHSIH